MIKSTLRLLVILVVWGTNGANSGFHSLMFHRTSSCGDPNVPQNVEAGLVDDVPFIRYSCKSRKVEPKQAWMDRFTADNPGYLDEESQRCRNDQETSKNLMRSVQERLNQIGGVHIVQAIYGCEWDDETGEVRGHYQLAYDGEDFLSLDLKTWTWTARTPQADSYKQEWDNNQSFNRYLQAYLTRDCPDLLKKLLLYGNSSLLRTELPRVSLLQKTPSSPIVCHATGFYPPGAKLFWTKDGEELHEDVEVGEVLPNPDGTFQMRAQLDLSDPSEDWGRYTCVFLLDISRTIKITPLTKEAILTNRKREDQTSIIPALVAHHALMIVGIVLANAAIIEGLGTWTTSGVQKDWTVNIAVSVAASVLLFIAVVVKVILFTRAGYPGDLMIPSALSLAALVSFLFSAAAIVAVFAGVIKFKRSGRLIYRAAISYMLWLFTCSSTSSLIAPCIHEFAVAVLEVTTGVPLWVDYSALPVFYIIVAAAAVVIRRYKRRRAGKSPGADPNTSKVELETLYPQPLSKSLSVKKRMTYKTDTPGFREERTAYSRSPLQRSYYGMCEEKTMGDGGAGEENMKVVHVEEEEVQDSRVGVAPPGGQRAQDESRGRPTVYTPGRPPSRPHRLDMNTALHATVTSSEGSIKKMSDEDKNENASDQETRP